jgi:hypothetical protein
MYLYSVFFAGKSTLFNPLLVSGVDPFSNANIYVLDQLIVETKTDLE